MYQTYSSSKERRYRYYVSSRAQQKTEDHCTTRSVSASAVEWRRIVPILLRMRVLTEADGIALACLCQSYSTLVKAQQKLNEAGILCKAPSENVMQGPLLAAVESVR